MIQLVSEWADGFVWDLDVDQNEMIVLSKSLFEITDIDKRKSDYTKSFSLPRSLQNDIFFGQVGDPATVGFYWNTRIEAPAWLIDNGNLIISGLLKLESSDPKQNRYNVSISGSIFTIKTLLGDRQMGDIDFTDLIIAPAQIQLTWGGAWNGGHMIFPVHDFGFGYGLYKKVGGTLTLIDIKNSATPIVLDQTLPAFRVNELLRRMFNSKGVTIEGSWFSESEVERIYVQTNNPRSSFFTGASPIETKVKSSQTITTTKVVTRFVGNPASAEWSDTNFEYTVPVNGTYYWDLQIEPNPGVPDTHTMLVRIELNGVQVFIYPIQWNQTLQVSYIGVTAVAGDKIRVTHQANVGYSTAGNLRATDNNYFNLVDVSYSGLTIDPSEYWANIKMVDFFKGILKIFNLIAWITPENKLRLDTYDYFMNNYGQRKDWTQKVNHDATPVIKPINGELRNPINIELADAEDVLNKEYRRVTGRNYGSYREDTRIPFTQEAAGKMELFSPGPLQDIISSNVGANFSDFIIRKYYQSEDNIEYEAPGLELFYYNGLRTASATFYTADVAGGVTTGRTQYPYFSNFRLFSGSGWQVQANTLDLNFTFWTPPVNIVSVPSAQGLYNRYFREMLRERYDEANKIVELEFVLNSVDIMNFSFGDMIVVNLAGTPTGLRILEIRDYSPSSTKATKVRAMITFIQ